MLCLSVNLAFRRTVLLSSMYISEACSKHNFFLQMTIFASNGGNSLVDELFVVSRKAFYSDRPYNYWSETRSLGVDVLRTYTPSQPYRVTLTLSAAESISEVASYIFISLPMIYVHTLYVMYMRTYICMLIGNYKMSNFNLMLVCPSLQEVHVALSANEEDVTVVKVSIYVSVAFEIHASIRPRACSKPWKAD